MAQWLIYKEVINEYCISCHTSKAKATKKSSPIPFLKPIEYSRFLQKNPGFVTKLDALTSDTNGSKIKIKHRNAASLDTNFRDIIMEVSKKLK